MSQSGRTVKPYSDYDRSTSESGTAFPADAVAGPRGGHDGVVCASLPIGDGASSLAATGQSLTAAAPSQATAVPSSTPSAIPSWIGRLQTASIADDMSAAIVNGQVTYSGLLSVLRWFCFLPGRVRVRAGFSARP